MLTPQQEKFCTGIACGLSQADAYRKAYPKSLKWKDKTVWEKASVLAGNDKVKARVKELAEKAAAKNEITVERVIGELAKIAFGNKRDLMRWGPDGVTLLSSEGITDDAAAMVQSVEESTSLNGGSIKLKTHDKVKALELLGRHLGVFEKDNEQVANPLTKLLESLGGRVLGVAKAGDES